MTKSTFSHYLYSISVNNLSVAVYDEHDGQTLIVERDGEKVEGFAEGFATTIQLEEAQKTIGEMFGANAIDEGANTGRALTDVMNTLRDAALPLPYWGADKTVIK